MHEPDERATPTARAASGGARSFLGGAGEVVVRPFTSIAAGLNSVPPEVPGQRPQKECLGLLRNVSADVQVGRSRGERDWLLTCRSQNATDERDRPA